MVATRVAEIDFAVLDDRVVPVGNVDRSVRSHLHVDRAEGDVIRLDQLDLLARAEAGSVLADDVAADAMASEIVGDQVALPVVGQVPAADDVQTFNFVSSSPNRSESHKIVGPDDGNAAKGIQRQEVRIAGDEMSG